MINTLAINSKLDNLGVVMSCLCALHCLAMPLVFASMPLFGASILADEMTENLLFLTAFLIGVSSLIPCYIVHHRRITPIALFSVGILLILAGRFGFNEGSWPEAAFSGIGAILFAIAHFINYRLCVACCKVGKRIEGKNL